MKFPRLKNPLLCRILSYVVVLGGFIAPIIIIGNLDFVPETIKIITFFIFMIGLIIYMVKNFALLMGIDTVMAMLYCYKKARKQFILPDSFSVNKRKNRINRFGKGYEPIKKYPLPEILRYRSSPPISAYSKGTEKIFAVYSTKYLDKDIYQSIVSSARTNSKSLKGKRKHIFLDKQQRKSPIKQATAIIIFADKVDEDFQKILFNTACKKTGDGFDESILPCIIDLQNHICTFDSLCIPNIGSFPIKNRCIKMIKKYIFDGRFPYKNSPDILTPESDDYNLNESLWEFWRKNKKELILDEKQRKKQFKNMRNGEIIFKDDDLYIKWNERGVWLFAEINNDKNIVEIDEIVYWDYPKENKISKADTNSIKSLINTFFAKKGYLTKYISFDD